MLPVIIEPDVELWAATWLRGALAGRAESYAANVWVSNATPNPRKDRMVIVRHDGGPRVNLLHQAPRLGVNVWATTDSDATNLAALVEGLLLSVAGSGPVVNIPSSSGPMPITDVQPRQFFSVELLMRGTES